MLFIYERPLLNKLMVMELFHKKSCNKKILRHKKYNKYKKILSEMSMIDRTEWPVSLRVQSFISLKANLVFVGDVFFKYYKNVQLGHLFQMKKKSIYVLTKICTQWSKRLGPQCQVTTIEKLISRKKICFSLFCFLSFLLIPQI